MVKTEMKTIFNLNIAATRAIIVLKRHPWVLFTVGYTIAVFTPLPRIEPGH